jgi:hypothetical protein
MKKETAVILFLVLGFGAYVVWGLMNQGSSGINNTSTLLADGAEIF